MSFVASDEPGWLAGSPSVDDVQRAAALAGLVLVIAGGVLAVRRGLPEENRGAAAAATVGVAAFVVPFALAAAGLDLVDPRNMIGSVVPLWWPAASRSACATPNRWGLSAPLRRSLLFAAVLLAVYVSAQMQRPDWRGAAAAIGSPEGPRILVVPTNGDDGLVYYLHAREFERQRFQRGIPGKRNRCPQHGVRDLAAGKGDEAGRRARLGTDVHPAPLPIIAPCPGSPAGCSRAPDLD